MPTLLPGTKTVAFTLVATGVLIGAGVTIWRHDEPRSTAAELRNASPRVDLGLNGPNPRSDSTSLPGEPGRPGATPASPALPSLGTPPPKEDAVPVAPGPLPSSVASASDLAADPGRRELELRARLAETEANRELAALVPLLGLSESQQDRVFAALAATSRHFDASMSVATESFSGRAVPSTTDPPSSSSRQPTREEAIHDLLNLDQQLAYEEHLADRDAWWSEFLHREEAELDALIDETLAASEHGSSPSLTQEPGTANPELPNVDQDAAKKNETDVTNSGTLPSPPLNGPSPAPSGALPF